MDKKFKKDNASYDDIDKKYIYNHCIGVKKVLMFNSDYETLLKYEENNENINCTILSIPEFRQALVYCLPHPRQKPTPAPRRPRLPRPCTVQVPPQLLAFTPG